MAEPIYQTVLGLYLTLEDFRKAVQPGQTIFIWMPPDFDRIEGILGQTLGAESMLVVRVSGGLIPISENNVHLFQPGPVRRIKREAPPSDPTT